MIVNITHPKNSRLEGKNIHEEVKSCDLAIRLDELNYVLINDFKKKTKQNKTKREKYIYIKSICNKSVEICE